MVDATVSKTVGHNARAGSTPALGTNLIHSWSNSASGAHHSDLLGVARLLLREPLGRKRFLAFTQKLRCARQEELTW